MLLLPLHNSVSPHYLVIVLVAIVVISTASEMLHATAETTAPSVSDVGINEAKALLAWKATHDNHSTQPGLLSTWSVSPNPCLAATGLESVVRRLEGYWGLTSLALVSKVHSII